MIGGILLDARESPRYFQTFYIRRAFRILPIYIVILTVFYFHHLPFQLLPGKWSMASPVSIPWIAYLTLMQNFWMVKLGWYGPAAMAITWSLAVEEQFYLTIPVLIRKLGRAPLIVALLCIVACAPTLRLILRYFLAHGDFACYVLMPCRADALCLGVLCALLVRDPAGWRFLVGKRSLLYCATGTLFVGIA